MGKEFIVTEEARARLMDALEQVLKEAEAGKQGISMIAAAPAGDKYNVAFAAMGRWSAAMLANAYLGGTLEILQRFEADGDTLAIIAAIGKAKKAVGTILAVQRSAEAADKLIADMGTRCGHV